MDATARTHITLLPRGLFPALGRSFMRQWHRAALASPHVVFLVAVDRSANGAVAGFLLGSTNHDAHTRAVLGNRRSLALLVLQGALSLMMRPALLLRFARSRAVPWTKRILGNTRPVAIPDGAAPRVAVLSDLAVDGTLRGQGTGAALVNEFAAQCRRAGASSAELVIFSDNSSAARFYEHLGWTAVSELATRDQGKVRLYRTQLDARS
ncbi:GNAT family N-acetyltransferase [Hoyosella sp. G463]|uniref:GNAT family N-acetyltransferase n=1 Tax=Lolliginicoccus lacisalsi TaxID=2742202 RepID=A0A927JEA2_9ACTN|nr:GNAT family N-acetyltransferase [Lolliginicoccus lacisalsi]MBD8507744.1 GNAT family N-acetyltransferase [Lolliginicoccus lacisalsi]